MVSANRLGICSLSLMLVIGQSSFGKPRSVVKVAASASRPDAMGKQTVSVVLDIKPKFYIFANPINNDEFAGEQTTVVVTSGDKHTVIKIQYPPGKRFVDKNSPDLTF